MIQQVFTDAGYCMLFNGVDELFSSTPGIFVYVAAHFVLEGRKIEKLVFWKTKASKLN